MPKRGGGDRPVDQQVRIIRRQTERQGGIGQSVVRVSSHEPGLVRLAIDGSAGGGRRLAAGGELFQHLGAGFNIPELQLGQRQAVVGAFAAPGRLPGVGEGVRPLRIAAQHAQALFVVGPLGNARRDGGNRQDLAAVLRLLRRQLRGA